ncbi:toxin glutamine deamidase domain-containing protein [Streptomyces sp. NPDC001339]|uniref:toxin glutamine deamidase domain-containing protein n=1 Tax=Streptomyces sp. NPDC001339 TaxID=3364563 RepID=UPI0036821B44
MNGDNSSTGSGGSGRPSVSHVGTPPQGAPVHHTPSSGQPIQQRDPAPGNPMPTVDTSAPDNTAVTTQSTGTATLPPRTQPTADAGTSPPAAAPAPTPHHTPSSAPPANGPTMTGGVPHQAGPASAAPPRAGTPSRAGNTSTTPSSTQSHNSGRPANRRPDGSQAIQDHTQQPTPDRPAYNPRLDGPRRDDSRPQAPGSPTTPRPDGTRPDVTRPDSDSARPDAARPHGAQQSTPPRPDGAQQPGPARSDGPRNDTPEQAPSTPGARTPAAPSPNVPHQQPHPQYQPHQQQAQQPQLQPQPQQQTPHHQNPNPTQPLPHQHQHQAPVPQPPNLRSHLDVRVGLNVQPNGLYSPFPHDQQALAANFPRNPDGTPRPYNDPFQPWVQFQNDGGTSVPGRSNNCADCTRSFMESWYGNPQVSAVRTYDPDPNAPDGLDRVSGERNGTANIEQWAGTSFRNSGPNSKNGYDRIANELRQAGHGASAAVLVTWPQTADGKDGGAHVFNAVNHNGRVIWVDSQTGEVSQQPINTEAVGVWHLVLDANRQPFDPAAPQNHVPQNQTPQHQAQTQQSQQPNPYAQQPHQQQPGPAQQSNQQQAPAETKPEHAPTDHQENSTQQETSTPPSEHNSTPKKGSADVSQHLADALRNDPNPFIYGKPTVDQPPAHPTESTAHEQPHSPDEHQAPADPAGARPDDADDQAERRRKQLERANTDPEWFKKYYREKDGHRHDKDARDENGDKLPKLRPTGDPSRPWMLASDVEDADPETYIDSGAKDGARDENISKENLKKLDESAKKRQEAIDNDHEPHEKRKKAKEAYEKNKTPENKATFDAADAEHSPLHGKMTRASEDYGEDVAEHHAIPANFEGAVRVDDRGSGNNRFDQVWKLPNGDFVVVEAKGSPRAELGERQGLPHGVKDLDHGRDEGGAQRQEGAERTGQEDSENRENSENSEGSGNSEASTSPTIPQVKQGTREYFKVILHEMETRGTRNLAKANSPAEIAHAKAELALAKELKKALKAKPSRITYVLVKGVPDGKKHNGYIMKQFDIRTEKEKKEEGDNDQDPAT